MDSAETQSAENQSLGPELAPVYHALWNELAWVHMKWEEFVEPISNSKDMHKRLEFMHDEIGR